MVHSERVERNLKQMRREGRLNTFRLPLQVLDTNVRGNTNVKKKGTIAISSLTLSFREFGKQDSVQTKDGTLTPTSLLKSRSLGQGPIDRRHNDMSKMIMNSKGTFRNMAEGRHAVKLMDQFVDWMQINQLQYESSGGTGSTSIISGPNRSSIALAVKGYGYRRHQGEGPCFVVTVDEAHSVGKFLISCRVCELGSILLMKPDLSIAISTGDSLELYSKTKITKNINGNAIELYLHWKKVT